MLANNFIRQSLTISLSLRMFTKHGQGALQEFSESMYYKFGVWVAILAGYCDGEGDPTMMLYVLKPPIVLYPNALS